MTSLFRPVLALVLCGVIACGHLPAWIHLAQCGAESTAVTVEHGAEPSHAVLACSHVCHHASPGSEHDGDHESDDARDRPSHDSDHCVLCHSLSAPLGVVWQLAQPVALEPAAEITLLSCDRQPAAAYLRGADPRGPPTLF
jgi:hypothetical protein